MTSPPRSHIVRCLTDVAKANHFAAVDVLSVVAKIIVLDPETEDAMSLLWEIRRDIAEFDAILPTSTQEDVIRFTAHFEDAVHRIEALANLPPDPQP